MENKITIVSAVWCPSCLILKKHLKRLKEEYQVEYELLDYDLDEDKVCTLDIGDKLPVMIYNDRRLIGEKSYDEIVDFLKECNIIWEKLNI